MLSIEVLEKALKAYDKFKAHKRIKKHDHIVILDYTQPSWVQRLYVYDRKQKRVIRDHHVAHGVNSSDPNNRALAVKFSNKVMSKCSSIGAVATGGTYYGRYGRSLNLHGLEPGINDKMFVRRIVIHKSNYVTDQYIGNIGRAGQSWGCPAVDPLIKDDLVNLIKGGTFCYFYGGQE